MHINTVNAAELAVKFTAARDHEVMREWKRRLRSEFYYEWLHNVASLLTKGHDVRTSMDIYTPRRAWTNRSWHVH